MTRLRNAVVAAVVVALVVVGGIQLLGSNGPVSSRNPVRLDELDVPSAGVVRWSPDATALALVVAGQLVTVRVGDAGELGRTGRNVVDAAWMADGRLIAVEGPIPTGQIVAFRRDLRVAGTTTLRPSIAFAPGRGLAVNDRGTTAAAIALRRETVGGAAHTDLAVVDLQSGATRVFETDNREESSPVFVDSQTVAYASELPGGQVRLHEIDLSTATVRSYGAIHDGPYGVLASGEVVVGHRDSQGISRLDAVTPGAGSRVLGRLGPQQRPVAVDRFGTRVLVRRFGDLGGKRLRIEVLEK